jgi:hypothetical protein
MGVSDRSYMASKKIFDSNGREILSGCKYLIWPASGDRFYAEAFYNEAGEFVVRQVGNDREEILVSDLADASWVRA